MKTPIIAALGAATLALAACSPSDSTQNNSSISELPVNEGDIPAEGNFGATDDFGNAAVADNTLLEGGTLGNDTLGNTGAVANGL